MAGKTLLESCFLGEAKVDPRTGGENLVYSTSCYYRGGGPPHWRGKRTLLRLMHDGIRLTPAPAGKTPGVTELFVMLRVDPPHWRGKRVLQECKAGK